MSADNWDECPICKLKKENSFKILKDKYGKISQDEYEKLKKELDEEYEPDDDYEHTPLREDYEQGVDDKGLCYVIYSGVCQRCGASWQFDKRDILPLADEDIKILKELEE